jgi:hypothetical protein
MSMKAMTTTVLDLHIFKPTSQREKQNKVPKRCGRRGSKSSVRMMVNNDIKKDSL